MERKDDYLSIDLARFSLDDFIRSGTSARKSSILVAYIEQGGDHAYLHPEGASDIFQVPIGALKILSKAYSAVEENGAPRDHYRIEVDDSAPCLKMRAASAGELLSGVSLSPPSMTILTLQAKVSFNANGEGTLSFGGKKVPCLGKPSLKYPTDLTVENIEGVQYQGDYNNAYKFKKWISKEFDNAEMPWAVKIWGQKGIFVHEGPDNLADNEGPSQGCIHLAPPNAEGFYNWITERTRVQILYPW